MPKAAAVNKQKLIAEIRATLKIHSIICEHVRSNIFRVTSGDNIYTVEIFFAGRAEAGQGIYGYKFSTTCNCNAGRFGKSCAHGEKVLRSISKDWQLLFPIFGIAEGDRADIWEKAQALSEMLEANSCQLQAA